MPTSSDQIENEDSMELPQPPPISSIGSEHERDSEISSTTPHSYLDFFSSRSLSYSLSSASVFSPSPAQPYPETGSDYDPFTDIVQLRRRRVKLENEGRCQLKRCFSYEFKSTQWINCFGTLWIIFSAYYVLCLLLGTDLMFPGSELFTLFLTWFIAWAGGYIVGGCGLPPLLGMLISGLLLRNLTPQSWLMFPENWKTTIRASSLALILMRSGLELDPNALKKSGLSAFRLTFIPGVVEACYTALIAHFLFHMPVFLALSLGFILAAVSPAVVVVGMFDLQKRGYGVEKGIPSLIVTAASFDDIVAISGFTLFIGLAIREEGTDFVLSLLHGPLSLLIGVAVGFVGGITIACTKIWDHRWKRSTVTFLLGMAFTFGLSKIHFQGGGALAAMVMGIVGSFCWQKKFPHFLSAGKSERHADETEKDFAKIWSIVFEPLLFGVIGISLNFHEIQTPTLPKSVLLVVLGLSVRLVAAYFSTYGQNFTFHERLFVALAWSPKATVQAALCSIPLEIIGTTLSDDNENYDDYLNWGNEILTTAVLSILITAPIGLLAIQILGPKLLQRTVVVEENPETPYKMGENAQRSNRVCERRDFSLNDISGCEFGSQQNLALSHLAKIEERLAALEGAISTPEATDIIVEARKSIYSTRSIVSNAESRFVTL